MGERKPRHRILKGIGVSPGVAYGRVCIYGDIHTVPRYTIRPEEVKDELARLDEAIQKSSRELEEIRRRVEAEVGKEEADIFLAHQMMLEDIHFYAQVERRLIRENLNVEAAIEETLEESRRVFSESESPYLRERADDVQDVGKRVLSHLLDHRRECLLAEDEKTIVAADELIPSVTVHLDKRRVAGFVTEKGGLTSHASILARAMEIPAVVGVQGLLEHVEIGHSAIVDGFEGTIHLHPTPEVIAEYERLDAEFAAHRETHRALIDLPSVTRDGERVVLEANIGKGVDVESASLYKVEGVGLYRTEFHFMIRPQFPDEEEQYAIYRRAVERMAPHPVTIRTLDLGGDKYLSYLPRIPEVNPYLGWRAIRVSLEHPEVLKTQLKAILRAGVHGRARILFPMIATIEDLRRAKGVLGEAEEELRSKGIPYDEGMPVGAMIEVPSAAILARLLLREVDFLSIGTNDLTQFTLAVDRSNEKVSRYYEPLSPAVLWLLRDVIRTAREVEKEVAVCGEMAGEPENVRLLLGLGLRHFSMSPVLIPDVKEVIRSSTIAEAESIAERALAASTAAEVKAALVMEREDEDDLRGSR